MHALRRLAFAAAAAALSPAGDALALATSAPPAEYRPPVRAHAKSAAAALAPVGRPLRIDLPEVAPAERARFEQKRGEAAASARGKPAPKRNEVVGFARPLPDGARAVALASLAWQPAGDGARVARIEVRSPGAAAVRLVMTMRAADPDLALRFAGNAPDAPVHGPYAANAIAEATERFGEFVSPVLEGDTAIVELYAAEGANVEGATLTLRRASHIVVAPSAGRPQGKEGGDIGRAAACNLDVACVQPSAALQQVGNGVAKLLYDVPGGLTFGCTGTLLNDTATSFTPYVLTAAHCVETAYEAATLDAFWFFRAQACGSTARPPYVQQTGGAMLLARSEDWDWALVRLNRAPPAGVFFAAWRAEPLPAGAIGTTLHHPQGDLLKFAQGSTTGYEVFTDGSSFIRLPWSQGTTEARSSGAALLTFLPEGGYYEVRGGLFGGDASCANRQAPDYFSRLDNMLPLVRQYLAPTDAVPASQVVVVEFYNSALDHYFMTADANEINLLDTGVMRGWQRTGMRFLAYGAPAPGTQPVCRFYLKPEVGDSHFYSADPYECARVRQQFARDWIFESPAVFHVALPDVATGACPSGTRTLWRFFNQRTTNHRYTPEVTVRDRLRSDPAWIAEGYGRDASIMCAPAL